MSRSSATSLMVRNASGALSKATLLSQSLVERGDLPELFVLVVGALAGAIAVAVYPLLQNRRRLEHHHAARRDRHLGAGLRIAADALALLAHHEGAERRQLDRLALFQAVGDLFQHQFNEGRRLRARQAHLLVDGLAQIDACHCLSGSGHRLRPNSRRTLMPEIKGLSTPGQQPSSAIGTKERRNTSAVFNATLTSAA